MTSAFVHDGTYSTFRGRNHGRPVDRAHTPGYRFVVVACRITIRSAIARSAIGCPSSTSPERLRIGAVLLLTSPFTPMLWMGEEWAASTRWPFFTSHPEPELAAAIGPGRLEEFAGHGWDTSQMIDPQDPEAYHEAILDWDEVESGSHRRDAGLLPSADRFARAEPDLADPRLDLVESTSTRTPGGWSSTAARCSCW